MFGVALVCVWLKRKALAVCSLNVIAKQLWMELSELADTYASFYSSLKFISRRHQNTVDFSATFRRVAYQNLLVRSFVVR